MSETDLRIREATVDDLPAVLGLYAQPDYDDGRTLHPAAARGILERMSAYPFYRLFVAEDDSGVVGTYALLVMENIGHLGTPSAIVESVAVAPQAQGLGVGTQLMRHALGVARERGCYKLALSSNMKREKAHAFYDRLGFRRHGYSFVVTQEERA